MVANIIVCRTVRKTKPNRGIKVLKIGRVVDGRTRREKKRKKERKRRT